MKSRVAHIAGRVTLSTLRNGAGPAVGLQKALNKVRVAVDQLDVAAKQVSDSNAEVNRANSRLGNAQSTASRAQSARESPDISPARRSRQNRKARLAVDRVIALSDLLDDRNRNAADAAEALHLAKRVLDDARAAALRSGVTPAELNDLLHPDAR